MPEAVTSHRSAQVREQVETEYRRRTPASRQLYERAVRTLPGGSTRAGTFYLPYPSYMARGQGCRLHDVDGNVYLDYLNNYTSLVHGHAQALLIELLAQQAEEGLVHGSPVEAEIALAEVITRRVPSVAQVRFTNSGTEAVMGAIRAARAYTGRTKILKMEGGYHGSYDAAEVSVDPGPEPPPWPTGRPDGAGLSPGLIGEVLVGPFNDLNTVRAIVERHRRDLAAVIIEPVMNAAGMIPATPHFLRGLRDVTRHCGVLLVFDEVVTFRLAYGGAQELYGISPDLTAFGKMIGGGLPIGAFGGRADVMSLFDRRRPDAVFHSGTFNGNAAAMVLGRAALELFSPAECARVNRLGDDLRAGFQRAADAAGFAARVTGLGSLCHVHPASDPVRDYRSSSHSQRARSSLLHLALLNRGVFSATRGMFAVSTPMDGTVVADAVTAFEHAVALLAQGT